MHFDTDSLYLPVEKHIHEGELVGAGIMPTATPSQKYAKSVVDNALKKNPTRWHWAGGQIWLVWVVLVFTWHTFAVRRISFSCATILINSIGQNSAQNVRARHYETQVG